MKPDPLYPHALWQRYTVFDGLSGMRVEDIAQDRRGYLWVATADGGASRYDGRRFRQFGVADGLPHTTVMSIVEGRDGALWFATLKGGLAAYDGRAFHPIAVDLPSLDLVRLRFVGDELWVMGRGGFARVRDGRCVDAVTEIGGQPLHMVYDARTDAGGRTWLASVSHGVVSLDGETMDIGGPAHPGTWPWMITPGADGHLWIVSKYTGFETYVHRYEPHRQRLDKVVIEPTAEGRPVRHGIVHARCDADGRLWLAHRGVTVLDGGDWARLAMPIPASTQSDTKLTFEDREGNVWIGFWGGGLAFCDPHSVERYTEADGLPDTEVTHLARDAGGRLWIGTLSGLARFEAGRVEPLPPPPGSGVSMSLAVDARGRAWSGTSDGHLAVWEDDTPREVRLPVDDAPEIRALCAGADDAVWVGTHPDGVLRVGDGVERLDADLAFVQCLSLDADGGLWIGLLGAAHSLFRYTEAGGLQPVTDELLRGNHYMQSILQTRSGDVWVGTGEGALRLRSGAWRAFTRDDGMAGNTVLSLAEGHGGEMWIGTSGGGLVCCQQDTVQVIRLGEEAAHNIVEAILTEADGSVWCGTRAGLVRYRPGSVPPTAVILRVAAGRRWDEPERVVIPESTPEIRVAFHALGFRSGVRQMRYTHRLLGPGRDDAWSPFNARYVADYDALPAGSYRFEVIAMDRDGLRSEPATVDIVVEADPDRQRLAALQEVLREPPDWHAFVGRSRALRECLEQIAVVAETDVAVLVLGETGTGKGLAAHSIHERSRRRQRPFIKVNCGALPEGVVESELFGYERGAFTGANERRLGRFELADGGTLFLDEIGDLSLQSQRVLLHVLEDKTIHRLGGEAGIGVDVRVVAATNRDLARAVEEGTFRRDLYFRLSEFVVDMPALRDRLEDIPLLARYFVERVARHLSRPVPELAPGVMPALQASPWPGNVRELEHVVQRAVLVARDGVIHPDDIGAPPGGGTATAPSGAIRPLDEVERDHLVRALEACDWVVYGDRGAARLLGIHPEKLRSRMRRHGLRRPPRR